VLRCLDEPLLVASLLQQRGEPEEDTEQADTQRAVAASRKEFPTWK
jgi:hypothetical protein